MKPMYKCYNFTEYHEIFNISKMPAELYLGDHLGGFSQERKNSLLDYIHNNLSNQSIIIFHDQIIPELVRKNYPNIKFKLEIFKPIWNAFIDYYTHPEINYKNFICNFNGSPHVSRKLLVAIIKKFGWFNPIYSSKNFAYDSNTIAGHVMDYLSAEQHLLYTKFFNNTEEFNQTIYTFSPGGIYTLNHNKNIYTLEHSLTKSFLHIVSETMATSYSPFVTEKFLYSVVTRGLFLAYAQPGWHAHLEKYYGFKRYTKLFDYRFDNIENPIERLVELMSMISKFSVLSSDDWQDLYLLEQDTIEYNYDHYFSSGYLKNLEEYDR